MPPKSKSKAKKPPGGISQQADTSSATTSTSSTPNWPALKPLIPSSDLSLRSLIPDQIAVIDNLFTANLCKSLVAFLSTLPLVTTPGKPKKGDAVRVNDRCQIDDARFAQTLWSQTALEDLVLNQKEYGDDEERPDWGGEVLGLNPNIRIYRYKEGQFFDQHYDDTNNVNFITSPTSKSIPGRTTWTLLIYLTTCEGGETIFYPDSTRSNPNPKPISVAPMTGMALFHRHGEKCMIHEGAEVTKGEKWVLRSDLVVKR